MNKIFLHSGQKYFVAHPAKTKVAICGRGWGKTSIDGVESYKCISQLPRSRGFFLGLTYTQILTKFLPPILDFWGRIGLIEHISLQEPGHYVVGVKPPDYWEKPFAKVKKYQNIISFYNGSYIELLSMDRKDLNLGGSYDWGLADEVQCINKERFYKEYHIGIRGNIYRYKSPLHHTLILTGTMPWLASGQWILDFAEKAKSDPNGILYLERSAYDNVHALGIEYFKKQRAELPALMYQIEIENMRVQILSDGFYPEFEENKHCYYSCYAYSEELPSIKTLTSYAPPIVDYDPKLPLEISFDFGANVTCLLVAQESNGEIKFINCFYDTRSNAIINMGADEPKNLLQRVMMKFIKNYGSHKSIINIWGDHTGHHGSDRSVSSYQVVEQLFKENKMYFRNNVEKTTNPFHNKKYQIINEILSERNTRCPKVKINQNYCKELIISIQVSPVNDDFTKDKRSERDKNIAVERQTHFSDAFDYLVYNKYKQLFALDGASNTTITIGKLV